MLQRRSILTRSSTVFLKVSCPPTAPPALPPASSDHVTVRGNRPGKPVQLQEYEIKYLCTKAREIFINQPILLELEAPIKICGMCPLFFIGVWGD